MQTIDFQTEPSRYRHWRIERDGDVAYLIMDVDQAGGLFGGYELKLNSYDLGVDIELNDAVQRLRFEHPEVRAVVIKSGKDNVFCAGANIRMLGKSTHGQKVNFCKFTNETRLAIEDASENSKQIYICAINGNAAGGGYELALAADHIMLVDDRRSAVALPETPLLAVLPGTGGLTRVTDKRKVRRDRADVFCSIEEGIRGAKAVEWRLVDEVVPNSKWKETVAARAHGNRRALRPARRTPRASRSPRSTRKIDGDRVVLFARRRRDRPRARAGDRHRARAVASRAGLGRSRACARRQVLAAHRGARTGRRHPASARQRAGDRRRAAAHRRQRARPCSSTTISSAKANGDWLMREIRHYLKRVLKRLDVTPRSIIALIEPGSCFAGTLAELAFAADRSLMLIGTREGDNRHAAAITLGQANFGFYPMGNGLDAPADALPRRAGARSSAPKRRSAQPIEGEEAAELGLVTHGLRGFRLGRRIARHAGGAHELLARRHDRHGSELALRRPGDHGNQDLRTADRLAELDLPAAERDRRAGRAQALRQRRVADLQ